MDHLLLLFFFLIMSPLLDGQFLEITGMESSSTGCLDLHKHAELFVRLFFLTRLSHSPSFSPYTPQPPGSSVSAPKCEGVPLCFILHFLFLLIPLAVLILPTVEMSPVCLASPCLSSELLVSALGGVA